MLTFLQHGCQAKVEAALGVIDSLSAGYRFLGRRVELLLVPVLLDLLLWLAPQLSIAPLIDRVAEFYAGAAGMEGMPSEMADMSRQVADLLARVGEGSNLLAMLVSSSLLHVPSLLATTGLVDAEQILIANPFAAFALFCGIGLIGLLLGVFYLDLLATRLPIGGGPKPSAAGAMGRTVLRHWLMILAYIALLIVVLVAASVPALLAVGVLSLVSPTLSSILVVLLSGALLVLFFYLYFVTAAIVLDNLPAHLAVAQSFTVVRNNFWATLGFVVLYNVIAGGIALALSRLTAWTPVGILVAILVNAYIGAGLTMALLVFYRTRVLRMAEVA
jgi:hypothetical protein